MSDFSEIKRLIEQQGESFERHSQAAAARLDALELQAGRATMAGVFGGKSGPNSTETKAFSGGLRQAGRAAMPAWINTKSGIKVPVLSAEQSMAALDPVGHVPSMGRVLRGLVLGGNAPDARELEDERKALSIGADPAGGYTVAGVLASSWVDLLRANMVLAKAGAMTVPMDSNTLTLARLTGDPTCAWHGENSPLDPSEPTFGALTLTARTVVCLVRLSLELSQDSANIEDILQRAIVGSMAGAIDSAGLVGAVPSPGGIFNLTDRNTVTSVGAPTSWDFVVDGMYELMADNVPQEAIGALIAHPALWKKMRKLKTGIASDNTPLQMPAEVAALPKLWTTAAPLTGGTTAKAVMGNWSDLLFGVRKNITVKVLSERFLGDNLQVAVLAYARVDFAATRAQSFVTLEGITVA